MKHFRFFLPVVAVLCTASFCVDDPVIPEVPEKPVKFKIVCDNEIVVPKDLDWQNLDVYEQDAYIRHPYNFEIRVYSSDPDVTIETTSDEIGFTFSDFHLKRSEQNHEYGRTFKDVQFKTKSTVDSGTIKVVARSKTEEITKIIKVERMRVDFPEPQMVFPCEGGEKVLKIDSNFDVLVRKIPLHQFFNGLDYGGDNPDHFFGWREVPTDWCTITPVFGGVKIKMAPYDGVDPRALKLELYDRNYKFSRTYVVSQSEIDWLPVERAALLEIYEKMNGKNWPQLNQRKWCTDAPLGEWTGIETDEKGHVTRLDIAENNATGEFPSSIGNLTKLESLNACKNQITGTLPETLGSCRKLTNINVWGNQLSGPFPEFIRKNAEMRFLWLNNNNFSGPLPAWLSELSLLSEFFIADNRFSGPVPASWTKARWWGKSNLEQQDGYELYVVNDSQI